MAVQMVLDSRPQNRQAIARQRELARRQRKARIRRNRMVVTAITASIGIVAYGAVAFATDKPKANGRHIVSPVSLTSLVRSTRVIPGHLATIPWPAKGQAAVAIGDAGLMARSPAPHEVPIASLTKMMTAYIVLSDHPIAAGEAGPMFTINASDVAQYVEADETDESNVPVKLGEHLSEYQLLEALLMPSADNVANLLAEWDAGSVARFVAKMNTTAKTLGLRATRYVDASGVNPSSRSTAGNQALLAEQLMSFPVVREIAAQRQVSFPIAGTIWNVNPAIGHDGIIGVKSGYTSEAQGCLATAAWEQVGSKHVLVVAVTLSQPNGLYQAADVDESLTTKATSQLIAYRPIPPNVAVAQAVVPWSSSTTMTANLNGTATVVGWPGLAIREYVVGAVANQSVVSTRRLGTIEFIAHGNIVGKARLVATSSIPAYPSGWQPS